ncbi:MAG: hypoxanthine phosphoribosyltransferase [Leptospiraceae bacterium]|nr:hypoxanthine phosphoribosyltransferase [Leptospiraceae bacterium]MCB1316273.1 hypoxanthine phosphoribosyltransferase [Leptospiraceae bacterium]MCB1318623.1 hypoxanthine phosphoribosyltransferase [Leptospiraceae bacterium]
MSENNSHLPALISRSQIETRVTEIGREITDHFAGKELTVIGLLKGCFIFMADLVRAIHLPVHIDFMEISSYGDAQQSSGIIKIVKDLRHSIEDRHVLLVEDIVDTGLTLNHVMELLETRRPASLHIAALLVKEVKQELRYPVEFRGFDIEDHFVVGYGLDYRGYYRNLNYVAIVEAESQMKLF